MWCCSCSCALRVDTLRASIALAVESFLGIGMLRKFMASALRIGCVFIGPASPEVPAPRVNKPEESNPSRVPMLFYYCWVMRGAIGAEVALACGPEVRSCGVVGHVAVVATAFVAGAIRAIKPKDVPTGAVNMTCWIEIACGASSSKASSEVG